MSNGSEAHLKNGVLTRALNSGSTASLFNLSTAAYSQPA